MAQNASHPLYTKVSLGPLPTTGTTYQLTQKIQPICGGDNNVPSNENPVNYDNLTPIVPHFSLIINGVNVPSTDSSQSDKLAMIDSGGRMVIVADDSKNTIVNVINKTEPLASPALCKGILWLTECSCLEAGIPIEVSSSIYGIDYQCISTDLTQEANALAICPPSQSQPTNTFIVPNGMNLGYQLFQHVNVGFDYSKATIYFQQ